MSQDGYQGAEGEGNGVPNLPGENPAPIPDTPTSTGVKLPYESTAQRNPYAPSYQVPNSQNKSNNAVGLLILGIIVLVVIGLVALGVYKVYQLTQSVDVAKLSESHQFAKSGAVDDTDRNANPDKPLTAPLQGKFMIVQLGVDLTKVVPSIEPNDSPKIQHPQYYATILDDKAKVLQEGRVPYNMEGILKQNWHSLTLYQSKDVVKQIKDPGPVDPDQLEQFGKFLNLTAITSDGDTTYATVDSWISKDNVPGSLLLAYNNKTGKALYTAEIPMGIKGMKVHAGKIYIVGNQQISEDDPKAKTMFTYGSFAVLDQQTGKQENFLKDERWADIVKIQMMGDTPVLQGHNLHDNTGALLLYKDGKIADVKQFEDTDFALVWADSEHVLYSVKTTKLEAVDAGGQVVKTLDLGGSYFELSAQSQDGKLYLFSNAEYDLGHNGVEIIQVDEKTFEKEDSTTIRLSDEGGSYLYGMLLPEQ